MLNPIYVWSSIVLATLLVILTRNGYLVAPQSWHPRGRFAQALAYAPIAALVAICAPEIGKTLIRSHSAQTLDIAQIATDPRLLSAVLLFVLIRLTNKDFPCLVAACCLYFFLI
jgi:branched-subunit amino acid transport protein